MGKSALDKLCVAENLRRTTLTGDVFRGDVVLGGQKQTVDIERIRLPLNRTRRAYVMAQAGMDDAGFERYQENLTQSIRNGISLVNRLHGIPEYEADQKQSLVSYLYQDAVREDDGSVSIYLVTRPMEPLITSDSFLSGGGTNVFLLWTAMTRLAQMAMKLEAQDVLLGAFDPYSICLSSDDSFAVPQEASNDPGYRKPKPRQFMAMTSLAYARHKDRLDLPYPAFLPANAHPSLLNGRPPSAQTDIYALAAFGMSVLNGTYNTGGDDFQTPSPHVAMDLEEVLADGVAGNIPSMKEFRARLHKTTQKIHGGQSGMKLIPVPLSETQLRFPGFYEAPQPEPPMQPEPEEPEAEFEGFEPEDEYGGEPDRKEPEAVETPAESEQDAEPSRDGDTEDEDDGPEVEFEVFDLKLESEAPDGSPPEDEDEFEFVPFL